MDPSRGWGTFRTSGAAYDSFMGRYSRPLAVLLADSVGVAAGHTVLDVGRGPGALTGVLVDRPGAGAVAAFDPSPPFVAECSAAFPGVEEARTLRFGREHEIGAWLVEAGLQSVAETSLEVTATYRGFDELWSGFQAGIGPAGAWCASRPAEDQEAIRQSLLHRLGSPSGPFQLSAMVRSAHAFVPG